jgi:hypothetical protein
VAKSRDNPCDNLTVAMLADQHLCAGATIPDQHHQLLCVPERQNGVAPFSV